MKILLTESKNFSSKALKLLRENAEVRLEDLDRAALMDKILDVEVLWIRLRNYIDSEVIEAAPGLKFIVTPTTGLNHIDTVCAKDNGIKIISLKGEDDFLKNIRATAEHTVSLTFSLLRNIPASIEHVKTGGWNRDLFKGNELYLKTVGIIGYGRLGHLVAKYFLAFGMNVLVYDNLPKEPENREDIITASLTELLEKSDIVTLHASYSDENSAFFGSEQFSSMKQGAWFINTARGELVDETALLEALETKHIAGAALDVLSDEHLLKDQAHPLIKYARSHNNLLITPHIGGCTFESMEATELFMAQKLCAVL